MKPLFITNPKDINADILGGVQICSLEFLNVIQRFAGQTTIFNIAVTKNLKYRLIRKLGIDSYDLYNFEHYKYELIAIIKNNNIDTVFINKAELIKVSKLIKKYFNDEVKVILMSHGNETGDYLHEISKPNRDIPTFKLFFKKLRLGINLYTESYYRHRFVDLVCAMSLEEVGIEKWLGAKQTFFFPRVISANQLAWSPKIGKVGFAGTLNHKPNIDALNQICDELSNYNSGIEVVLIGGPEKEGADLARQYHFVKYLGRMSDEELKKEAATWMYFLNPVFWFSRGASMKLAMALGWGIPVITTIAGTRGYLVDQTCLELTPNNAKLFTNAIINSAFDMQKAQSYHHQVVNLFKDTYTADEIAANLKEVILEL